MLSQYFLSGKRFYVFVLQGLSTKRINFTLQKDFLKAQKQ